MALRTKVLIGVIVLAAPLALLTPARSPVSNWLLFAGLLAAVVLSAGMKVPLPKGESTMSVNFPFIFLAIVQLSPRQAMTVAAISVFAQCKFRVKKLFSLVQIAFNVANAINATAASSFTFASLLSLHVPVAPALTAAAGVYFFVSTVPVALVIGWSTKGKPVLPLWRENFLWFLPFYLVGAALAAVAHFLGLRYGWSTGTLVLPVAYTIYRAYNGQMARIRDQAQHIAEMEALHLRTIEGLAMAIEAKDQDTHDHLLRVRVYVTEIGKALELTDAEMEAVKTAALLHDIGKLAVPERIINKPGKLSQEEFETMKIHPAVGADILARVRFPYPVVPIVRSHHEWWNGMGYPDGLQGEAIPIGARILTVVDSFDAMASDRPYRRAMPLAQAMGIVRKLAGTQFDPRVVEILEQRYVELEKQARREGENLERLNLEIDVSRGIAPGAGFEQDSKEAEVKEPGSAAETTPTGTVGPFDGGPSRLIAAATEHAQTLLAATASPGYPLGLDDTLAVLVSRLSPLIPFACCVLYLKEGETVVPQRLERAAAQFFSTAAIALGEGISGWAAHHQQSIVNGNATVEPNYLQASERTGELSSALAVPLRDMEGSVFGVLSLYAKSANAFSRDHLRALEAIETEITRALKNARQGEAALHEAPMVMA
jgi:putative nucleotidyltransferase with HDIG domain